jgi:hypothetical protein
MANPARPNQDRAANFCSVRMILKNARVSLGVSIRSRMAEPFPVGIRRSDQIRDTPSLRSRRATDGNSWKLPRWAVNEIIVGIRWRISSFSAATVRSKLGAVHAVTCSRRARP